MEDFKSPTNWYERDLRRERVTHPSGIECIEITMHMSFCLGKAVEHIWQAGLGSDNAAEDLSKAIWYLNREIFRISEVSNGGDDKGDDTWSALRDFFDDDTSDSEDTAEDFAPVDWDKLRDEDDDENDECFACDGYCDGSCLDTDDEYEDAENEEEDEDTAQHRDTYSDGRRRVTVSELRERLAGDATGDDPLELLVTSILYHVLTDNLPDAFADD